MNDFKRVITLEEAAEAAKRIESIDARMTVLQEDISNKQTKINELYKQIHAIEGEQHDLEAKIQNLRDERIDAKRFLPKMVKGGIYPITRYWADMRSVFKIECTDDTVVWESEDGDYRSVGAGKIISKAENDNTRQIGDITEVYSREVGQRLFPQQKIVYVPADQLGNEE